MGIEFTEQSHSTYKLLGNTKGYSLVEILVTLAIAGIITGAIYQTFLSQQKSYMAQDQIAETQQNLRAALDIMVREIRMAGYDPKELGKFGIILASASSLKFTADIGSGSHRGNGDIDPGETFLYQLYDSNHDGSPDALRRTPNGAPVAINIQNLEFYYTLEDGTKTLNPPDPGKIRSVQVSILAKASKPDQNYTDTHTYTTGSGTVWGPFNDNYRRRLVTITIRCRNMGL